MAEISIVVPIYNVEKQVKRAIDSIINQSFTDLEIILVNDGSTDNSGQICDDYKRMDGRIKVIHKKNGGLSSARNAGIEESTSPFIGFIDGDDFINESMYEILHNAIINENSDITSCNYVVVLEKETNHINNRTAKNPALKSFNNKQALEVMLKDDEIHRSACNKLYKKSLFEGIRFPEGILYEDTFTIFEIYAKSNKATHVEFDGYYYLLNHQSITRQSFNPKHFDAVYEIKKVVSALENLHPDLAYLEKARLGRQYVIIAYKILASYDREDKKSNENLNRLLTDFENDYEMFTNNNAIGKKFKFAIILLKLNPKLFYFLYHNLKKKNN